MTIHTFVFLVNQLVTRSVWQIKVILRTSFKYQPIAGFIWPILPLLMANIDDNDTKDHWLMPDTNTRILNHAKNKLLI